MSKIQAIRGMNDILPGSSETWLYVEDKVRQLLDQYGYSQIRMPLVESTKLFKRSIGDATDIVEKEMYAFEDRNGEGIALRPEGTASCVRAALEHGLLHNQIQRLWYQGPMFRYEKPQKGRYRQFHQIGLETFGMAGAQIDAEIILLTARLWESFGISEHITLQINTLGSSEARKEYRDALVEYLTGIKDQLDEDSQRRLDTNPLRILDSKDRKTQSLLNDAPLFETYLDDDSRDHFAQLTGMLDAAGLKYEVNPRLVRGLDYYNKTVFEWVTDKLGAQGTVCGGGRYDGLVEQLGGKPTFASGFGMGIERFILLLEELDALPKQMAKACDVYFVAVGKGTQTAQVAITEPLRSAHPDWQIVNDCAGGSFKSQMKKADKSGARIAIILGEQELEQKVVGIKDLRQASDQKTVCWGDIDATITNLLSN